MAIHGVKTGDTVYRIHLLSGFGWGRGTIQRVTIKKVLKTRVRLNELDWAYYYPGGSVPGNAYYDFLTIDPNPWLKDFKLEWRPVV